MGFQNPTASNVASLGRGNQNDNGGNRRQADAFVNVYIPTRAGRRKVGYMPLYASRATDKAIIDRLMSGGEEALEAFNEAIEVEFSTATTDEDNLPLF